MTAVNNFKDIIQKKKKADLTSDLLLLSGGTCFHPQTDIYFCSAVCCAMALPREEPEGCRQQKTQAALPHARHTNLQSEAKDAVGTFW